MKTNFKKLPGSKINLEVTLENKEFKDYWERAYSAAVSNVSIKGFRPGMAPKEIAEQAINKEKVLEVAIQNAVRFSLDKIGDQNNWAVIDRPQIEVKDAGDPHNKGELKYKAELTIFPEVAIGDYKKIAKKAVAEKIDADVSQEEIDKTFEWVRKSRAPLVRVARGAKKGDVLDIDIETKSDGKSVAGGDMKHDKFELGEGKFVPGFEEKLEGHQENEKLQFSISAPKNYWQKDLQGKTLDFAVKINDVFEAQLAEANDEFAKTLGKFQTIAEVKKNIDDGLKAEKEEKEKEKRRIKILDEIVQNSKIDLPEILVSRTLDGLIEEYKAMIQGAGKDTEQAKKDFQKTAERRVAANLVMYEIAKLENIAPSKEEVEEESKYHTQETKGLDAARYYDYIYAILLNRKVFEFLEKQ